MASKMLAQVQRNQGDKPTFSKEEVDLPMLEPHQALVKISHVAQNPTDVLSFHRNLFGDGAIFGCDFSGTVEKTSDDVTRLKKGDVIAGLIRAGEIKGLGAYAEYTVADERISFKLPSSISPAEASTIPLAATTAWLALYSKGCLNIDRHNTKNESVLIWGGSSSVGLYAIQLASIFGLKAITTCSPRNFDLVKSHGADHVFDYSDPEVIEKIKQVQPNLVYVFDTIANEKSSALASQTIHEQGGGLCTVRPNKANTENVITQTNITSVLVWTAFLKEHRFGELVWPASKDDNDLASELFGNLPRWIESGKLKPNKPSIKRGLDAVPEGFQEYRNGKVSAYKIVYEI